MSDYAADTIHKTVERHEYDQAAETVANTRARLEVMEVDLGLKALSEADPLDLLIIAGELDRIASSIRMCAVELTSATKMVSDHVARRAMTRGYPG